MEFLLFLLVVLLIVGIPLIAVFRSMQKHTGEEWALVATAKTEAEVAIWTGALHAAGLRVRVHFKESSSYYPSLNEFELVVPSREADAARKVLAFRS